MIFILKITSGKCGKEGGNVKIWIYLEQEELLRKKKAFVIVSEGLSFGEKMKNMGTNFHYSWEDRVECIKPLLRKVFMYLENHFNVLHEPSSSSFKIKLPNRFFFYPYANAQIQRQVRIYVKIYSEELKGLYFQQIGNLNL